ncbi:AI-2E family transporter [Calycomorphotria hydatis]|uniref:AI-2 transport protein TqsA n=1 Tax=Calycomorphotria hydatis TaxID=2528027 RepID=A0A517T576_9PLAN|nr:AI-2E family transporter [Calycomorphotria hydatis]QDT63529.1 AI-2 transport protein TqsA [Calycomorphotria hydatis]
MEYESRIQTVCLLIITSVVIAGVVYWLQPVLLPLVVAIFVVSGVTPILNMLEQRLGANRLTAAAITFLGGLVILVCIGWLLWMSILEVTEYAPQYRARVTEIVEWTEDFLSFNQPRLPQGDSIDTEDAVEAPRPRDIPLTGNASNKTLSKAEQDVKKILDQMIQRGASAVSTALLDLFSAGIIVLIYVFFLLLGAPEVPQVRPKIWQEIDQLIRGYLSLKTVISLVTGFAFGLVLKLFGVPMATAFGMLAFLLNYIPNIGPLIATVLPIPLIILHPDASITWMVLVIGLTSTVQFVSGNVIEPNMMGKSADLHPIVVLSALMFWGMIWGLVGMFLATPITAGIKIGLSRFERTRPVAEFMAGRWSTPPENMDIASVDDSQA